MKTGLILMLALSSTVCAGVTLPGLKVSPVSAVDQALPSSGELLLLKAQIPGRNEIAQVEGTKFKRMQDLDGDGWRDDSPTPEHVVVTTNSFPACNPVDGKVDDMLCFKGPNVFEAWVGGAYDKDTHIFRIPAPGGHADGSANSVYGVNLNTLIPFRETDPSPLDGEYVLDLDKDGVNETCRYPSHGPTATHTYDGVIDVPGGLVISGSVGGCVRGMSYKTGTWFYDTKTLAWTELSKEQFQYARTGYDKERNVVYSRELNSLKEFDLNTNQLRTMRGSYPQISAGVGTALFDNETRKFYWTQRNGLWSVDIDSDGKLSAEQKLSSEFTRDFTQDKHGVLWAWNCVSNIKSYDPRTGVTTLHAPSGMTPLNTKRRVYSKLFAVDELDVIMCMDQGENGLYMYNPPNGEQAGTSVVVPDVDSSIPETVLTEETFESENWVNEGGWLETSTKSQEKLAGANKYARVSQETEGCVEGNCTKITIKQYTCCGIGMFLPIRGNRENVTLEYDLKLAPNWNPRLYDENGYANASGGKLPGLADQRHWPDDQCGNGGAQSDGINCWSMRGLFDKCAGDSCKENATTRFGGYLYHKGAQDYWGDHAYWDDGKSSFKGGIGKAGQLENDRWYNIKMQVVMNAPGHSNGVIRGWIGGVLSFERTDVMFRLEGHDNLHVRNVWMNVYFGGQKAGPPEDTYVLMDNLIVKGK